MDSLLFRKLSILPFDVHSSKVEGPRVFFPYYSSFWVLSIWLYNEADTVLPYIVQRIFTLLPALSLEKTPSTSTTRFLPNEQYYRCYSINIIVLVVIY